jgi:choice-of-anchor B domain-containing protein
MNILAHSEKDKARYVSTTGTDNSFCDNPLRPCKTIIFATKKANKGDKILVASGYYNMVNSEQLYVLQNTLVPIFGGYNRFDHFQSQSPETNITTLTGVPIDMAKPLRENGFNVISDGISKKIKQRLVKRMESFKNLALTQADENCTAGIAADIFPCKNIDLVAHVPLLDSETGFSANDIWGHVDLNTNVEYALLGVAQGVVVYDLSNPTSPRKVGIIEGLFTNWRDIKVYQYFDKSIQSWQAYAYVSSDLSNDFVSIIDLNQLPLSVSLVEQNKVVKMAHNIYISNVNYTYNIALPGETPWLQLIGSNKFGGEFHSYSLEKPQTLTGLTRQNGASGYSHDGTSFNVDDSRKLECQTNVEQSCLVFLDFNEDEIKLWDITSPSAPKLLSTATYTDVDKSSKYVHSGWWSEDKNYFFVHDEFDEMKAEINTTLRIFAIDSLKSPHQVGQWTGPTSAVDHNGYVRGNKYYMSNYERGLTILDISNPAIPVEVGFFDTFPDSNNPAYNGAWGVYPFLPSGLILVSDIQSGLYILREQSPVNREGALSFDKKIYSVEQGQKLVIEVDRSQMGQGSKQISVDYDILPGSAEHGSDYIGSKGTLNWDENDESIKKIEIDIHEALASSDGNEELVESFFIQLSNPTNGASLISPRNARVNIAGRQKSGNISFIKSEISVREDEGEIELSVIRQNGIDGELSVEFEVVEDSATATQDIILSSGILSWTDGDVAIKKISISIVDDSESEPIEKFLVKLKSNGETILGNHSELVVSIYDDESNLPPTVNLIEDFEVNTRQKVILVADVNDPENVQLDYEWRIVGGNINVSFINRQPNTLEFSAPNVAGTIKLQLTVTDMFGQTGQDTILLTVIESKENEQVLTVSGGSVNYFFLLVMLALTISTIVMRIALKRSKYN